MGREMVYFTMAAAMSTVTASEGDDVSAPLSRLTFNKKRVKNRKTHQS